MERQFKIRSFLLTALLSAVSYGSAQASGFALIEVNASGQGNAYAGAAAYTNNASTIFFNPAGMMHLDGQQIVLAAHYINPNSDFSNDGSATAAVIGGAPLNGDDDDAGSGAFVPNFYWSKPINEQMSFGIGVNTPFGLKTEYDDDWVGRYHGILSDLQTVNFNPSLGYRVNDKLSVGGGLSLLAANVELSNAIDFGAVCLAFDSALNCGTGGALPQAVDGKVEFDGDNFDDLAYGFNLGLIYMISERTRLGVSYRSEVDIEADGDADFTVPDNAAVTTALGNAAVGLGGPIFLDTGIKADVTLPASFSVSVAHQVDKFTWLADITWTGWSSFDELRIEYDNPVQPDSVTTEDWDDSLRYSIGFDYQYSDKMVLRAGLALDETPVPSPERRTPRLPGDDRTWLSLGLSYQIDDELSFDIGYSHLFIDDAEIDHVFESSVTTLNATLEGDYDAEVDILSAQLNWNIQ